MQMKKIHLLRHAKSDWGNASLADIDRPLNAHGIRIAQLMASKLAEAGCHFSQNVFCSPAVRTQETIKLISEQLPAQHMQWVTEDALYTFESSQLKTWVQSLDESITELLIIGHNPALTYFCNELTNSDISHIPTCGYVQLTATKVCSWPEVSNTLFKVKTFLQPKALGIN